MIWLLLSLSLASEPSEMKKAIVYTATEFWKISETNKQLKGFTKKQYKVLIDRDTRKVIGLAFPLIQIIVNREIRYRWEF